MRRQYESIVRASLAGLIMLLAALGGTTAVAQVPMPPDFYERMRIENPFAEGGNAESRIAAFKKWLDEQKPREPAAGETPKERLLRERFNARVEEYRIVGEQIAGGTMAFQGRQFELIDAALALAADDAERVMILEIGVGAALLNERIAYDKSKFGIIDSGSVLRMMADRLDREFALVEEQERQEARRQEEAAAESLDRQASASLDSPHGSPCSPESSWRFDAALPRGVRAGRLGCGPIVRLPMMSARFGGIGVRWAGLMVGIVGSSWLTVVPATKGQESDFYRQLHVEHPFADGGNGEARIAAFERWFEKHEPQEAVPGETPRERQCRERFNARIGEYRIVREQIDGGVMALDRLQTDLIDAALACASTDAEHLELFEIGIGEALLKERIAYDRYEGGAGGSESVLLAIAHRLDREIALVEEQERQAQRAKD